MLRVTRASQPILFTEGGIRRSEINLHIGLFFLLVCLFFFLLLIRHYLLFFLTVDGLYGNRNQRTPRRQHKRSASPCRKLSPCRVAQCFSWDVSGSQGCPERHKGLHQGQRVRHTSLFFICTRFPTICAAHRAASLLFIAGDAEKPADAEAVCSEVVLSALSGTKESSPQLICFSDEGRMVTFGG